MEAFNILSEFWQIKLAKSKDKAFEQYKEFKVNIHFLCNKTFTKTNYLLAVEKSLINSPKVDFAGCFLWS